MLPDSIFADEIAPFATFPFVTADSAILSSVTASPFSLAVVIALSASEVVPIAPDWVVIAPASEILRISLFPDWFLKTNASPAVVLLV